MSLDSHRQTSTADGLQLLSIVLPAFNEQDVLPKTYARFTAMGERLAGLGLDYELLFVNDGSRDETAGMLDALASDDRHVRAVHLTRNFGHQSAVTAGLSVARGDAVAVMDCDLQDPPEILPEFIAKWRQGFQVVYAVRKKRKEWLGKRIAYWSFYRLLSAISELQIPLDSGDFCLMDRRAVDLLNALPERQRFVRGLRTWIGLRQSGIAYERDARAAGVPQYTFRKLVSLAMDGLVSFSSAPLRLVTRLGMLSFVGAMLLGLWVIVATIYEWHSGLHGRTQRGWASLACIVLFMGAVQMISLGVIGEYLSRIFIEVKGRPTFLIASIVGCAPGDEAAAPSRDGQRQSPAGSRANPTPLLNVLAVEDAGAAARSPALPTERPEPLAAASEGRA
ncbi:MAG TPA: glycosyltransferase family 2 protein [Tepidisphaeraceae bacterium]|nr:glycosyltransferase family 2 protein [Tepidisphaeraceae bacterium]